MQKVRRERAYTGLKLIRLAEDVHGAQTAEERHVGSSVIREIARGEVARKSRRSQAQRLFLNIAWLVQTLATVFFLILLALLSPLMSGLHECLKLSMLLDSTPEYQLPVIADPSPLWLVRKVLILGIVHAFFLFLTSIECCSSAALQT